MEERRRDWASRSEARPAPEIRIGLTVAILYFVCWFVTLRGELYKNTAPRKLELTALIHSYIYTAESTTINRAYFFFLINLALAASLAAGCRSELGLLSLNKHQQSLIMMETLNTDIKC